MKLWFQIGGVVSVLLAIAAGALAVVQNSARTTDLTFDLSFAAWQLQQPVPVVYLVGGALVIGFLLGLLLVLPRSMRLSAKVRDLERRSVLSDTAKPF